MLCERIQTFSVKSHCRRGSNPATFLFLILETAKKNPLTFHTKYVIIYVDIKFHQKCYFPCINHKSGRFGFLTEPGFVGSGRFSFLTEPDFIGSGRFSFLTEPDFIGSGRFGFLTEPDFVVEQLNVTLSDFFQNGEPQKKVHEPLQSQGLSR